MKEEYNFIAQDTMLYRTIRTKGTRYVEEMLNPGLEFEEVHVVSLYDNFDYSNMDLGSITVHPIRRRAFFRYLVYPLNEIIGISLHVFKIIKKYNIQMIQSVGGSLHDSGMIVLIAGKLAGVPAIVSIMNNYDMKYLNYPSYFLHNITLNEAWERLILQNATKVRVISKVLIEYAIKHGVSTDRIEYIPRKVNLSHFEAPSEHKIKEMEQQLNIKNKKRILFAGRLTRQKNVENMIQAISVVKNQCNKDITFLIAGEGHLRRKLSKLVQELGLKDCTYFLGEIPYKDLILLYQASDIFLFPTRFEGLGRAVLEAMASGLPVITSNEGPVTELVKNEMNGLLVRPNNPKEIANAILRLLDDEALRQRMSRQSKLFVKKYSLSRVNKLEAEFIKQVIDEHRT